MSTPRATVSKRSIVAGCLTDSLECMLLLFTVNHEIEGPSLQRRGLAGHIKCVATDRRTCLVRPWAIDGLQRVVFTVLHSTLCTTERATSLQNLMLTD